MKPRVAILDYGCGNLRSVVNAVREVGGEPHIVNSVIAGLPDASHVILPGQGAFRPLGPNLRDELSILKEGEWPILGICLGMQLMCEGSEEALGVKGLGWLPFWVSKLSATRLPHIGWAKVADHDYYFCHSYAVGWLPHDRAGFPADAPTANLCEYNSTYFLAEWRSRNLWAVQFHPEKSGKAGLAFLREFLKL